MSVAVVTGAAQGLGKMIADTLHASGHKVYRWDVQFEDGHASRYQYADVRNVESLCAAAAQISDREVGILVNCAGFNELVPFENIAADDFDMHMSINASGIMRTTQVLLYKMSRRNAVVCNIISNASHMPMRMSLCYNASKAAAAMMTRQMARELFEPHGLTVFGVSPNRLRGTPMSDSVDQQVADVRGWSIEEVRHRQLAALPIGEETDPGAVAEFIGFLLSSRQRHRYLHGSILEYGI